MHIKIDVHVRREGTRVEGVPFRQYGFGSEPERLRDHTQEIPELALIDKALRPYVCKREKMVNEHLDKNHKS